MPRTKKAATKLTTPVTETTVVTSEDMTLPTPTAESTTAESTTAEPFTASTDRETVVLDAMQAIMALTAQGPEALLAALRSGQLRWRLDTAKGLGGRKLSKDDYSVIRARAKAGESMKAIAADFGISPRYCRSIVVGRRGAGGPITA